MDATLLPRSLTSTPFPPLPLSRGFPRAAVVAKSYSGEDELSPRPPLTSQPTISPSLLCESPPVPSLPSPRAQASTFDDRVELLSYPPTARHCSEQPASSWNAAFLAHVAGFPASDDPHMSPPDSERLDPFWNAHSSFPDFPSKSPGHVRLPTMGELLGRIPSALPQAERVLSSQPLRPDKFDTEGPPAVMPFISKLYHMLSHPEELQDVLVWDADGEAFIVHASDRLVQEVFPQVFGHGNFASFTRQLNVYSFCRLSPPELRTRLSITPSSAYSAWAHPLFTRDNNPDTLHLLAPRPNKARERSKREKREREREGERDDGRERSEKMKRRMAG